MFFISNFWKMISKSFFLVLLTSFLVLSMNSSYAASIRKCRQSDGTLVFTNKPCAIATRSRPSVYNKTFTNKSFSRQYRKQAPFRQKAFVQLQKKMITADSIEKMEEHSQEIINKTITYTKKGKLNTAYNMIAASYARLSEDLKNKQWKGQKVSDYALKIRLLFEKILISQSTTSTAKEFNEVVQAAWIYYYNKKTTH